MKIDLFGTVLVCAYLFLIYKYYRYSRDYITAGSKESTERLTASKANDIYKDSVSKESIEKEIKPILKAITKQARKGFSEVVIFNPKWYPENRNATRKQVVLELEDRGYEVSYWYNPQRLIIEW